VGGGQWLPRRPDEARFRAVATTRCTPALCHALLLRERGMLRSLSQAISKYGGTHIQSPNFGFKLCARKFLEARAEGRMTAPLNLSSLRHMFNAVRAAVRLRRARRRSVTSRRGVCVAAACRRSRSRARPSSCSCTPSRRSA
jgi:hypothetical protein